MATADIFGTDTVTWFCTYSGDNIVESEPAIVKGGVGGLLKAVSDLSDAKAAQAKARAEANGETDGDVNTPKYSISDLWKRDKDYQKKIDITEPFDEIDDWSTVLNGDVQKTSMVISKKICRFLGEIRGTSRAPSGF